MGFKSDPDKTLEQMSEEDNSEEEKRRAFLLMGVPGTGKTKALSTINDDEKAIEFDFDDKGDCLDPQVKSGQILKINLGFSTKTYKQTYNKTKDILISLRDRIDEFQWSQIDSLTNFYALLDAMGNETFPQAKDVWNRFDWIDVEFWNLLYACVAATKNVVLTSHESYKDKEGVISKVLPVARKALSEALPGRFKETYHAVTYGGGGNVSYGWETKPNEAYGCNTLIANLPFQVPNHYDLLLSTDWTSLKDEKEPVDVAIKAYEARTKRKITNWS